MLESAWLLRQSMIYNLCWIKMMLTVRRDRSWEEGEPEVEGSGEAEESRGYESGVVGVVCQGQLHSLGLVWRQRLVWDVWRGSDDSLYWHRRVRDLS